MRRLINNSFKDNKRDNDNPTCKAIPEHQGNILEGLCICLTGLLARDKENLHSLILRHGGRYVNTCIQKYFIKPFYINFGGKSTSKISLISFCIIYFSYSYSRDLFTHKTSHLIAKTREGQKFEEAVKCKYIDIVR